jgi:hypothetical protein
LLLLLLLLLVVVVYCCCCYCCCYYAGQGLLVPLFVTHFSVASGAAYFNYLPPVVSVLAVNDASGNTAGGGAITLVGQNFGNLRSVTIGGSLCTEVMRRRYYRPIVSRPPCRRYPTHRSCAWCLQVSLSACLSAPRPAHVHVCVCVCVCVWVARPRH